MQSVCNSQPVAARASSALAVFRRYVTGFVNLQDFSVLPEIMQPNYRLVTASQLVSGRDTAYRQAVAKQMRQFPGLVFTLHEIFVSGSSIAVRFTEHGASVLHDGAVAAWPSIAIYDVEDGLLQQCTIEQDYQSRRRQLADRQPALVDPPALAPWDTQAAHPDPAAEQCIRDWLAGSEWLRPGPIQIDDSRSTGGFDTIIAEGDVRITRIVSGSGKVAFHAVHSGLLAQDFAESCGVAAGRSVSMPMSGLVTTANGRVCAGNIIRDRLGLQRQLTRGADN